MHRQSHRKTKTITALLPNSYMMLHEKTSRLVTQYLHEPHSPSHKASSNGLNKKSTIRTLPLFIQRMSHSHLISSFRTNAFAEVIMLLRESCLQNCWQLALCKHTLIIHSINDAQAKIANSLQFDRHQHLLP